VDRLYVTSYDIVYLEIDKWEGIMKHARMIFAFVILIGLGSFRTALAANAVATVRDTQEGVLLGVVQFEDSDQGLKINAELSGVPPGKHGFHIHAYGSCDRNGKAAGGHFNPDTTQHGLLMTDGFAKAHAGDLGNIDIAPDGTGKIATRLEKLSLSGGAYSVAGRAVIVHEAEDDFGQPTGNAGARIGCGTITLVE
jgi:superoxide dismutase, Cu-Zn family